MKRCLFLFFSCVQLIAFSQNDSAKKVTITGRVVESRHYTPVDNGRIILYPLRYTYFTDDKGYFEFDTIPAGRYDMKISARGFRSRSISFPFEKTQRLPNVIELEKRRLRMPKLRLDIAPFQFELTLALQQGWRTMGEAAIGVANYRSGSFIWYDVTRFRVGTTFNFSRDQLILGPGITAIYSPFLLTTGGSLRYYTTKGKGTLCFSPHLGLNAIGVVDLFLGYEIPLTKNVMKPYINHFSITLAVPIHGDNSFW
jgi:hypothetical protein